MGHPKFLDRWRDMAAAIRDNPRRRALVLFAVWTFLILFFFSFSTRQEYYNLPAVPGLALLIAGWMQQEEAATQQSRTRRWGRLSSLILFAVGIVVFAAAVYVLQLAAGIAQGHGLADLLKKNPDRYALSFGHIFDLTPQALGAFRTPLLGFGLAMLAGTALNWWWRRRGRVAAANTALTGMMIAVLFCTHLGFIQFSPILTSKSLALAVKQVYRPDDVIVINAEYEPGATMNFYTGEPVHILRNFGNLWYGSFFPDTPQVYEDEQSFARLWSSSRRVFLWSDEPRPKLLEGKTWYEFAQDGGKYIYTNKPN